jgi:predicted metal-dependent HD superfamily phosphohydrolase
MGADKADTWFGRLQKCYSESHRHYHNASHIVECLREFDSSRHLTRQPIAVELAIWFHDAIYDPRAADNEERSAELARQCILEAGGDVVLRDCVARLVLATKHHDSSLDPDAPLMVDIDLSILGQSADRFWEYERQIREEYYWVPREVFGVKRAEILERFLARERIYRLEWFFEKYERQARKNLGESLRRLRGE